MSRREFHRDVSGLRRPGRRCCRLREVALAVAFALIGSATAARGQPWTAVGPEVIRNGQVEGQAPTNPVEGGVKTVVPVPGNPDQVILGTVNGGIWRTTNFSNASPTWSFVTPNGTFPAAGTVTPLSLGALSFTRNDDTRAYAGLGLTSAFLHWGTAVAGPRPWIFLDPQLAFGGTTSPVVLLRSTDSGASWSAVTFTAGSGLAGVNISGVQSRGSNVVVVTGRRDSYYGAMLTPEQGLWRSSDTDNPTATFTNLATGTGDPAGLPVGDYTDLVNGPGNISLMYTAVVNAGAESGVYRSTDAGQTWTAVYTANTAPAAPGMLRNIRLAGRDGLADPQTVYAAMITPIVADTGQAGVGVTQVVRFGDAGFGAPTVTPMAPQPGDVDGGVNPGGQGIIHVAIVGDPTDANVVYVGGDRQTFPTIPNTVGATNYTGRIFRGTVDPGTGNTVWATITHNGTNGGANPGSAPHADSRSMVFIGSTLYHGDDGGIYRQSNPSNNTGVWSSKIGTGLQITEVYAISYDRISSIVLGSDQDTGAMQQSATGSTTYDQIPGLPRCQGGANARALCTANTQCASMVCNNNNVFLQGDGGVVLVDNISQAGAGRSVRYASSSFGLVDVQRAVYDAANNPVGSPTRLALNKAGGGTLNPERWARIPAPFVLNRVDATGERMVAGTAGVRGTCEDAVTRCRSNADCVAAGATTCGGGAAGSVWESTDTGNNFAQVGGGPLGLGESVTTILAGGRRCAANNVEVLFVGTDTPAIYRRTAAGGGLTALTGYAGGTPWDLIDDPENWAHLFVVDVANQRIWRSLNADSAVAGNVAFTNITNNLLAVAGAGFVPMTIEFINGLLAVGGLGGVYATDATAVNPTWSLLGTGMPNAIVMDVTADQGSGRLFAGMLGRGVWTITAPVPRPLNHFECYEIHRPPLNLAGVSLIDQFGLSTVTVKQAKRLCAPANKNCEDPTAALDAEHLTSYTIKQTTPRFQRVENVTVTNQFGSIVVDLVKPDRLLVPTAKSIIGPPPPLVNPIDHFKCYKVKGARFRRAGITVETQFGSLIVDIKRPLHLCAPVDKNGEGLIDPDTHLMCYLVRGPRPTVPPSVSTINQFMADDFALLGVRELCVPSIKTL